VSFKLHIKHKTILMFRKQSYLLLFSLLFIAFSCKSETKTTNTNIETKSTEVANDIVKTSSTSDDGTTTTEKVEIIKTENNTTINREVTKTSNGSSKVKSPTKPTPPSPPVEKVKTQSSESTPETPSKDISPTPINDDIKEVEVIEETEKIEDIKEDIKPEKPSDIKTTEVVLLGAPSHKTFNQLLSSYVSTYGKVNYKGLKADNAKLDKYLSLLESLSINDTWSRNDKLAFWINAYNAYTIKLILNNYPVKSITDLEGGKPWDKKWIKLNGKTLSLNNIENDIIRPQFNESRIHFAVNCAAKSCPPLLNEAFDATKLDNQLEQQTKRFINNKGFNTLSKNKITISKIFEWYAADFGNVAEYINRYAPEVSKSAKIDYKEYNWALNE